MSRVMRRCGVRFWESLATSGTRPSADAAEVRYMRISPDVAVVLQYSSIRPEVGFAHITPACICTNGASSMTRSQRALVC